MKDCGKKIICAYMCKSINGTPYSRDDRTDDLCNHTSNMPEL